MITCSIPYIDGSGLLEDGTETSPMQLAKQEHINILKKLLAFKGANLRAYSRTVKGEQIKYLGVPDNSTSLETFIANELPINKVSIQTIGTNQAIVIDVLGLNNIKNEDFDYIQQEREYISERLGGELEQHQDLEAIINDEDSRTKLYEILGEVKETVNTLLNNPKIKSNPDSQLYGQLRGIKIGFDDPNTMYRVDAAMNFLKWSIQFTDLNLLNFEGSSTLLKELELVKDLPTFDERKRRRGELATQVDNIKNKYYIFGKLKEIVEELKLASTKADDIFETYNRYTILDQLEKSTDPSILTQLDKIEKALLDEYSSKSDLLDVLEEIIGETSDRKSLNKIVDDAIFKILVKPNGEIRETLLSQVIKTKDNLAKIQEGVTKFMVEGQVDLLYDSYLTYNLRLNSEAEVEPYLEKLRNNKKAYQASHVLTKDKIRESIYKANGNIGMLSYYLKQGTEIKDDVISLMTQLLTMSLMEADVEKIAALQRVANTFDKYKDNLEEYSEAIQTYTFDLSSNVQPEKFESRDGKLVHKFFKKVNGVPEEQEELLPIANPVYNRYYKLSKDSDDLWAYRADDGFYYRVFATKAIKGKNHAHRYRIEEVLHKKRRNELADRIYGGENIDMYGKQFSRTITNTFGAPETLRKEQILWALNAAFKDKFKTTLTEKQGITKIDEVVTELLTLTNDKKIKKLLEENFAFNYYNTRRDRLLKSIKSNTPDKYIIQKDGKYLLRLQNRKIILATATVVGDGVIFSDNGKIIDEDDIQYYYTKGKSFSSLKPDSFVQDVAFENRLAIDSNFKEFYDNFIKEYDMIAAEDATGFLVDGKLGQIVFKEKQNYSQLIQAFKENPLETSFNKFDSFFKTESTPMQEKKNAKGQLIDKSGKLLKPGEPPVMEPKRNINVDGIDLNEFRPAYTTRITNQNYVSGNVLMNLLGMVEQNATYSKLYDLEPQLKFALLLNKGSGYSGGVALGIKGKKFADKEAKNAEEAIKTLEFIIKAYGYNDPVIKDSLGRGSAIEKPIEWIRKLTYFQQLALNLRSNIFNNLPIGQVNNFLVASSKKYGLDIGAVRSSYKELISNTGAIMAGTVGHINVKDSHYIVKLAYTFNAISGLAVDSKNFNEQVNPWDHYLSYKSLFLVQAGTEVMNQLPLMMGFMKSYELSKKPDGSSYTMYDAVRINGKKINEISNSEKNGVLTLVDQEGNLLNSREIATFTSQLNTLNSQAQGDYGKYQKVRGRYEFWPSLALTFAGWLYPNLRKRFSRDFEFDKVTQQQNFGGYQLSFIMNTFGNLNEYKELFAFGPQDSMTEFLKTKSLPIAKKIGEGVIRTAVGFPLHILNTLVGFKGLENESFKKLLSFKDAHSEDFQDFYQVKQVERESDEDFKERLEEAHEQYVGALKTAALEYTLISAMIVVGLVLNALGDDEDEDPTTKGKILKFLEVQSRQLTNDLSLGAPLINPIKPIDFFSQRSKDPFVILRTIDINRKFIMNLVGFQVNLQQPSINFNIDDEYQKRGSGYDRGDLKLGHTAMRAFGPLYQLSKFWNADQQDSVIKLLNQGAIFTDTDLNAKDEEDE